MGVMNPELDSGFLVEIPLHHLLHNGSPQTCSTPAKLLRSLWGKGAGRKGEALAHTIAARPSPPISLSTLHSAPSLPSFYPPTPSHLLCWLICSSKWLVIPCGQEKTLAFLLVLAQCASALPDIPSGWFSSVATSIAHILLVARHNIIGPFMLLLHERLSLIGTLEPPC